MYDNKTNEELCLLTQNGDINAFNYLMISNDKFIHMIVQKYVNVYDNNYDDIYSLGCMGFMEAVKSFDCECIRKSL